MRTPFFLLYSFIATLCLNTVFASNELHTITGKAQGTTFSVKYWTESDITPSKVEKQINNELNRLDKLISNYRNDSDIEIFNKNKTINKPIDIDAEIYKLLNKSQAVYRASQHCYDPTIKPLFKLWGFKRKSLNIPNQQEINDALAKIGFSKIKRKDNTLTKTVKGLTIDLSAIGQGYAIQKLSEKLEQSGIQNYLVEIGGEMQIKGKKPNNKPWMVGVERPVPSSQKISEIIRVKPHGNIAIITSGTYRHYYDKNGIRYSHILDPMTGMPVKHNTVSATVLLGDATLADAWATALLCLGSKQGLSIANRFNIPVIYYDQSSDKQLVRKISDLIKNPNASWEIMND